MIPPSASEPKRRKLCGRPRSSCCAPRSPWAAGAEAEWPRCMMRREGRGVPLGGQRGSWTGQEWDACSPSSALYPAGAAGHPAGPRTEGGARFWPPQDPNRAQGNPKGPHGSWAHNQQRDRRGSFTGARGLQTACHLLRAGGFQRTSLLQVSSWLAPV